MRTCVVRSFRRLAVALLVTGLAVCPATAQPAAESSPAADSANDAPFLASDGLWLHLGVGRFDAAPEAQLPGQRNHVSGFLGLGAAVAAAPWLSLEFELLSVSRQFDTEGGAFIIVVDDETRVTSSAVSLGGRLTLPPSSPLRAYASVALAYVHTEFQTDATLLGIPGVAREQSDGAVSPVLGLGVGLDLGPSWMLRADWRRLRVSGSFPKYEIQEVALGGTVLALGASWRPKGKTFGAAGVSPAAFR